MSFPKIESREKVVFYDTDSGGVVSNIAYLRYVEKARCELFAEVGFPLDQLSEKGVYPTVVRTEIDYRKAALLGQNLLVKATFESVKKLRMFCQFSIEDAEDSGLVYAECKQTIVLVKMPEEKPVRVPDHLLMG